MSFAFSPGKQRDVNPTWCFHMYFPELFSWTYYKATNMHCVSDMLSECRRFIPFRTQPAVRYCQSQRTGELKTFKNITMSRTCVVSFENLWMQKRFLNIVIIATDGHITGRNTENTKDYYLDLKQTNHQWITGVFRKKLLKNFRQRVLVYNQPSYEWLEYCIRW